MINEHYIVEAKVMGVWVMISDSPWGTEGVYPFRSQADWAAHCMKRMSDTERRVTKVESQINDENH